MVAPRNDALEWPRRPLTSGGSPPAAAAGGARCSRPPSPRRRRPPPWRRVRHRPRAPLRAGHLPGTPRAVAKATRSPSRRGWACGDVTGLGGAGPGARRGASSRERGEGADGPAGFRFLLNVAAGAPVSLTPPPQPRLVGETLAQEWRRLLRLRVKVESALRGGASEEQPVLKKALPDSAPELPSPGPVPGHRSKLPSCTP